MRKKTEYRLYYEEATSKLKETFPDYDCIGINNPFTGEKIVDSKDYDTFILGAMGKELFESKSGTVGKRIIRPWQIVVWIILAAFGVFGLCMLPVWRDSDRWIAAGEYKAYERKIDDLNEQIEDLNADLVSRNQRISGLEKEIEETTGFGSNEYFSYDEADELATRAFLQGYDVGNDDGYEDVYDPQEALGLSWGSLVSPNTYREQKVKKEQEAKEAAEEAGTSDMMDDIVQEPDPTEYTSEGTPINDGFKKDAIPMQKTDRSSCFSEIGYDESEGLLVVTFRSSGASYLYYSVPEDVWEALASADSIGHYYKEEIKGEYTCEKLK